MKPKSFFITATGTEVGKTLISCGILRLLKNQGRDVGAMKPAASGGVWMKVDGKKEWAAEDALLLRQAAGVQDSLELINPVCYKNPLAPYAASKLENRKFSWPRIEKAYAELSRRHSSLIVEGVGGVCVPLAQKLEVTDLILRLKLPALLVCSAKLGTLNHTLLSLRELRRKKINCPGIILNHFNSKALADRANLEFFREKKIPVLAAIPERTAFKNDFNLLAKELSKHPLLLKLLI